MDRTTIDRIVETEWNMLLQSSEMQGVNVEGDKQIFDDMRRAQFLAWSDAAAESYLMDLKIASSEHRNLVIEKNIRMMQTYAPEMYDEIKGMLEPVSEGKSALVTEISNMLIEQMDACYKKYPHLSTGQLLRSSQDTEELTSVETYQKGELMTYSESTLNALRAHILDLSSRGESLAENILGNTVRLYGYSDLDSADKAMQERQKEVFVTPNFDCCAGGCSDDCCSDGDCTTGGR